MTLGIYEKFRQLRHTQSPELRIRDDVISTRWSYENTYYIATCTVFPSELTTGATEQEARDKMKRVLRDKIGKCLM